MVISIRMARFNYPPLPLAHGRLRSNIREEKPELLFLNVQQTRAHREDLRVSPDDTHSPRRPQQRSKTHNKQLQQ